MMRPAGCIFSSAGRVGSPSPDPRHPALRQAMATLEAISDKQKAYWRYQARLNWLREQATREAEAEEDRLALDAARAALEAERTARGAERAALEAERVARTAEARRAERLIQKLRAAGIDPEE